MSKELNMYPHRVCVNYFLRRAVSDYSVSRWWRPFTKKRLRTDCGFCHYFASIPSHSLERDLLYMLKVAFDGMGYTSHSAYWFRKGRRKDRLKLLKHVLENFDSLYDLLIKNRP